MSVMAKYVRIFWPEPKDEDVGRRNRAVAAIQSRISGIDDPWDAVALAAALADAVADGKARDEFAPMVEKAIVDAGSDAFVRDGHDLEMIVVALVAALDLVRRRPTGGDGWTATDAVAAGLWSALSFQSPVAEEAIELLRQEVLVAARERTMEMAEQSRVRAPVPEIGPLTLSEAQPTNGRANAAYRKATEPLVKALRENAELDREELEFLWWTLEDWSEALASRVSDLAPLTRALVAGIDGASKLRRLPASGHRNVVLRGAPAGKAVKLGGVVSELGGHAATLANGIDVFRVGKASTVFPLFTALVGGGIDRSGADVERDAREWGARALLEGGIIQVAAQQGH